MAEKDTAEKVLEAYNDVFADIVNVLLFQGRQVISEDELEDQDTQSHYKADGALREQERDVAKRWKSGKIKIAFVGFENQTAVDSDMPFRVIGYDGAEYRAQLSGSERYPVITLVLYFGCQRRWKKPRSLLEQLKVPKDFQPFVNDYKINVFEIAFLTEEQVKLFRSDFRIIADYFVQKRKNGEYKPEPQVLRHVQETLQMLSIMGGDHRFEEIYNESMERGPQTMCEMLDRMINKGKMEGIQEGIREGRREGIREGRREGRQEGIREGRREEKNQVIFNMYQHDFTLEQIATVTEKTVDEVKFIIEEKNALLS